MYKSIKHHGSIRRRTFDNKDHTAQYHSVVNFRQHRPITNYLFITRILSVRYFVLPSPSYHPPLFYIAT